MKHLKALCDVLQTDLNSLAGDEIEVAEDEVEVEVSIMRELRELTPAQREAVLGIIGAMRRGS